MLRVENDRRFSLGHARITLEGVTASGDGGFRILREGYAAANLGRRGWQVQEEKLQPVEIRQEGQDTILVIGPRLTRHLEPGPLVFLLPAAGVEASLFWPDDIDVFDGDLPPETVLPREAEIAPSPPPVAPTPIASTPSIAPTPPPPVVALAPPDAPEAKSRTPLLAGLGGSPLERHRRRRHPDRSRPQRHNQRPRRRLLSPLSVPGLTAAMA
jgi:hypothetical protein